MSAPGKHKVMQECGDSRRPNIAVKVGNEQQYVLGSSSETAKTSPSTDNNSIGDVVAISYVEFDGKNILISASNCFDELFRF